jgi:hypothetical protein
MLPFVMPTADQFFASPKRVFAHYFWPYPLSLDNQLAASDYYNTQYLTVNGESGKHADYGGLLRIRPLPVAPSGAGYILTNLQTEIQTALARGITGFCVDILSITGALSVSALSPHGHLNDLIAAATAVDPRFAIIPMLDMTALLWTIPDVIQIMSLPTYALPDGRKVMAAFDSNPNVTWWQSVITALNAANINIAFWPVFLGAPTDAGVLNPLVHTVGGWGTATPVSAGALTAAGAHAAGLGAMLPMLTQQFRPDQEDYWEAHGTATLRASWAQAIATDADCVQCVTWNDFSESGQVCPYTDATLALDIGTGFYDLTGYYASWFATGSAPPITQDVLYWCYRRQSINSLHPNQPDNFAIVGPPGVDEIECLAFLTLPGVVKINGYGANAPAGISSWTAPLVPGVPTFTLMRNGSNVFYGSGGVPIVAQTAAGNLDLTYFSGSIS